MANNSLVLTHNIQKLTDAEIDAINEEFGHWDDIEHLSWVTQKIEEKSDSYTDAYMKQFQFLIDQEEELGQYASEEWLRIHFQEFQKKDTEWIRERIKDYIPTTISEMLESLKWLEQCYEHHTPFIEEGLKFYRDRGFFQDGVQNYGMEVSNPYEECQERLVLEECEKFSTDYIDREIARLKDDYLIRDPQEELKHRMNLNFFEGNIKDKEKIAEKDTFWDKISVHGLENMQILKEELNDVGKGFCLAKWNQVSIL